MDKELHNKMIQVCDAALKAGGVQVLQSAVDVIQYANSKLTEVNKKEEADGDIEG